MGRERQKKKNRSSIPRVKNTRSQIGRTKRGRKKVGTFEGSVGMVVGEHWDRKLTLLQNYRRLGLTSRLNGAAGGLEKRRQTGNDKIDAADDKDHSNQQNVYVDKVDDGAFSIPDRGNGGKGINDKLAPKEVRVDRDPETGRILRVLDADSNRAEADTSVWGTLDDPLNSDSDFDSDSESGSADHPNPAPKTTPQRQSPPPPSTTSVIAELEAHARAEAAAITLQKQKRPRQQSQREIEWIARLVGKHGDDFRAMARDRRLNPVQQTESDIRRRVGKWRDKNSSSGSSSVPDQQQQQQQNEVW